MYAALPMYDIEPLLAVTDLLWASIRDRLRDSGIAAPDTLMRQVEIDHGWMRPDLLLSQTCGLPFVRQLQGRVRLVGAVDHGLAGIDPGQYCSRIVARRSDLAAGLGQIDAYRGKRCAYNAVGSQSGAGAMRHLVLPLLRQGRFFGKSLQTGSHFASISAVAAGRADIAAIDAATWRLAERHLPDAGTLAVIASTEPTPGLPLITALNGPAEALFAAVSGAFAALLPSQRDAIGIQGLVPRQDADFAKIAAWDRAAVAAGYAELG